MAASKWFGEFARRMSMLFHRKQFDRDMVEELRLHAELREREHREFGLSPAEAHRQAQIALGNSLLLREEGRAAWGWTWLENFAQDLRYAFRMLRKAPGFTSIAVLTLALGIGANTAIFSIVDAVFLRPLPFPNGGKIYLVDRTGPRLGGSSISMAIFVAWEKQRAIFKELVLLRWMDDATLTGSGEPVRLPSAGVSTGMFSMLGARPALGRDFSPEEGRPGGPNVVMISYDLWQSRFGGSHDVIGRTLVLNGEPFTLVGIVPPGFDVMPIEGLDKAQLWFPIQVPLTSQDPVYGMNICLGLLKPGVTPAHAEAALTPALSTLRREFPNMFGEHEKANLEPLRDFLGHWAGAVPLLLFAAVGLVLLVACANVASMSLARSTVRKRELAIRTALGAGRRRIVRQLLTESVVLAILGGLLGLLACNACFGAIVSLVPADLPHIGDFRIDGQVLLFSFMLSVLCGVFFGLVPALGASRLDLTTTLKESTAQSGARSSGRLRGSLVSGEIAISGVLVICAALTLESLGHLVNVRPGFDPGNVLTFNVILPDAKYGTVQARNAFYSQAISQVQAIPGVVSAALADVLPFDGGGDILFNIVGGSAARGSSQPLDADFRLVSPGYFSTLRIPLVRGRAISKSDDSSSRPVVVINHAMAVQYWGKENPIGQEIWIGKPMGPRWTEPAPREIVGIVGDIRDETLSDAPEPAMYVPYSQRPGNGAAFFVIRTQGKPLGIASVVRDSLKPLDPDLPLGEIRPLDEVVTTSVTSWRFRAILLGIFGALALFIAAIGVYGVISYSISQRTHEIGVRMALGAQKRDVLRLVVGRGLKLAGIGIAVGLAAAFGLTRLIANLLYGVKPTDPLTFAGVAVLLLLVALAACYIPARRAVRVDPMTALRYE